ncbi:MAG: hypothetical protein H0T78_08580, partial [Longispora sp.]|nr:hypothetical protein [Longispora sp. (in: high G+C Gram-positive bacteria)]
MRRFLTAAVTLGAVTAGVLGVTAPAHAMKRACDDDVAQVVVEANAAEAQAADADGAEPVPGDPDALPAEVWGVICGQLPLEGQGRLAQTDKLRNSHVSEYRKSHVRPDTKDVVHVYSTQQLEAALAPRVDEAGKPLPLVHELGLHMTLD